MNTKRIYCLILLSFSLATFTYGNTPVALTFTEQLHGFLTFEEENFKAGYKTGKKNYRDAYKRGYLNDKNLEGGQLMFHITVKIDDVETLLEDKNHAAKIDSGYIQSELLGGFSSPITEGTFNLYKPTANSSKKQLRYWIPFVDGNQQERTLVGFKDIEDNWGIDILSDSSTLYVQLFDGFLTEEEAEKLKPSASGILIISLNGQLDWARSIRTHGAASEQTKQETLHKFLKFVTKTLFNIFVGTSCLKDRSC